jgi:hypothetical protein
MTARVPKLTVSSSVSNPVVTSVHTAIINTFNITQKKIRKHRKHRDYSALHVTVAVLETTGTFTIL